MELSPILPEDAGEVEKLFLDVFSESDGVKEGEMVSSLARKLLTELDSAEVSGFVTREGPAIIACILFSQLKFEASVSASLLSPVAVASRCQGRGVGQQLIRHGLNALAGEGVELVVTYGDPAFYTKVGFQKVTQQQIPAPYPLSMPHGWQALSPRGGSLPELSGSSSCVEAFQDPACW